MVYLTKAQEDAVRRIYDRKVDSPTTMTYEEFRQTVEPGFGYVGIMWCGMYLGIEPDGHTHS